MRAAGPPQAAGPVAKASPLLLRPAESDVKGDSPILSTRHAWSSQRPPAYVALYSYKAKDEDELSFQAGDVFIHVKRIDDGWMFAELEGSGDNGETTLACSAMSAWHGAGMQHVAGACGSPPLRSPD